jgi:hypothetical protein
MADEVMTHLKLVCFSWEKLWSRLCHKIVIIRLGLLNALVLVHFDVGHKFVNNW